MISMISSWNCLLPPKILSFKIIDFCENMSQENGGEEVDQLQSLPNPEKTSAEVQRQSLGQTNIIQSTIAIIELPAKKRR